MDFIQDWRNRLGFSLRNSFQRKRTLLPRVAEDEINLRLQREFNDFLNLFSPEVFAPLLATADPQQAPLRVADVGARNFCFAPVIENFFRTLAKSHPPAENIPIAIHGIEVDGYRRFKNGHTRADYGFYFAQKVQRGTFHVMDFLNFQKKLDCIFLLNPFVYRESVLHWGLPKTFLQPQKILAHCFDLLGPQGLLVLSSPTQEEWSLLVPMAQQAGFELIEERIWKPSAHTAQERARFGGLFLRGPRK